jgi:hypothetical protein
MARKDRFAHFERFVCRSGYIGEQLCDGFRSFLFMTDAAKNGTVGC